MSKYTNSELPPPSFCIHRSVILMISRYACSAHPRACFPCLISVPSTLSAGNDSLEGKKGLVNLSDWFGGRRDLCSNRSEE